MKLPVPLRVPLTAGPRSVPNIASAAARAHYHTHELVWLRVSSGMFVQT